jgi:hypothetical protein
MRRKDELEGFVYGGLDELDSRARQLLRETFPGVDLERILIMEEGGTPPSPIFAFALMGVGGFMIVAMLGAAISGRRRR